MTIEIKGYEFRGPFKTPDDIENKSGVYAVLCGEHLQQIIDIGESATVKTRLETHDRRDCWKKNCKYTIVYAVLYTPDKQPAGRKEIEQDIRNKNPDLPCGEE